MLIVPLACLLILGFNTHVSRTLSYYCARVLVYPHFNSTITMKCYYIAHTRNFNG